MNRITRNLPGLPILIILFFCAIAVAEASDVSQWENGWHQWTVAAVDTSHAWCCYEYVPGGSRPVACRLGSQNGYHHSPNQARPDAMNIFVEIHDGQIGDVQALAASCPVQADAPISVHNDVSPKQSVEILAGVLNRRSDVSSPALAAIAVHEDKAAKRVLLQTARHDIDLENRKDAVFWIGQVRAAEMSAELEALMFKDSSPELREHAAFSWSQTSLPNRTRMLARLGQTDKSKTVRSRAWFWLAQVAAEGAETALNDALRAEASGAVRHDIVFAMSQLPEDRGVTALIKVVEDKNRPQADRKQAMFWLAQSKSERAYDYLAGVLDY